MNTNEHETVAPLSGARLIVYLVVAIGLFIGSCLTAFSQTTNSFFQFVQEQSERRYTNVPREVLAAYYLWYGQPGRDSWKNPDTNKQVTGNTARYPVKGSYSSHDPAVIDWHIDQAKAHGITCFVVSWWGTGEWESWGDKALSILIERAEKKDFKIAVYWEQAPDVGQAQIDRAIGELSYVVQHFGKSEVFLKVDGKPVIFAYGRIMEQIPATLWPEIIQGARDKAGDFVLMVDGYHEIYARLFDGLHTYGDPAFSDKFEDLSTKAAGSYRHGVNLARQYGRISCVTVCPGYDDRKHNKPGFEVQRHDGRRYEGLWEEALKSDADWVLVTSWNEWPEGTEIEPSVEFGDKYLKLTATYAKRFLSKPPLSISTSRLASAILPSKQINQTLAGRNVAILTQDRLNNAEFWIAYCGAITKRFTWADLTDSAQINAKKFPIIAIIRGEHFTGTIKRPGDVKQAFIRYLREGGFLVVLPLQPWPLYYDDSLGGKTVAITDDLHLRVNSWPGFPAPTELNFLVNTNALPGLPTRIPFPTTGDLRWTGASLHRGSKYDNYVPLAQLRDTQNRYFGEGAVYIEHKTLPVSPGKSIYVWMRTAEAIGEDKFYPALFEFISTKLSTNAKPRSVSKATPQK